MHNSPTLLNVEIKAKCRQPDVVRAELKRRGARFHGLDTQTDTFFPSPTGRLKLRQGSIENHLIYYHRDDTAGPKTSTVWLARSPGDDSLLNLLTAALGAKRTVKKQREIYYVGRSKVHVDFLSDLGFFVEIEVVDLSGDAEISSLEQECFELMAAFKIAKSDLVIGSYADMLESQERQSPEATPPVETP